MTVGENVAPAARIADRPQAPRAGRRSSPSSSPRSALAGYADYYPAEISGGMKKRAGLGARPSPSTRPSCSSTSPRLASIPSLRSSSTKLVRHIRDTLGTTIVIVSHELASIFDLADRVVMLDRDAKGIIVEGDPPPAAGTPVPIPG